MTLCYFPKRGKALSIALLFVVIVNLQHGGTYTIRFEKKTVQFLLWLLKSASKQIIILINQFCMWFGVRLIILKAGIQGMAATYCEAAVIDGATERQILFKITLPLLMPVLTYVVITSLIGGMQIFDIPFVKSNLKPSILYSSIQ